MKYFAVMLPLLDEEKSKAYRRDHLEYLNRMKEEGKVWIYGRFADGSGGMVIYQAESLEMVQQYAKQDPYVQQGARSLEIREWVLASR
ncbi:hypothetical protein GXN76_13540 [Kroppenstedtia pulmonis]|uniref:YCII-related domain-containing protein n=1 Tax=Kroppenstedtia pulmonis TaxID=1380685 RepID=A0A7D3XJT2_9BACL|nr:YciI family protein [Kroppenstedtia pulmonis]QKG85384.1 hypothetical protein GXN76_13540 [Kroppenstedtia pulmonis]